VSSTSSSITVTPESTPVELARAALAAQGGEKFKHLENMTLSGTVNIYPASSPQSIPGKFLWITAGECLRIELNAQPLVFKQIFDGQRSYSSIPRLQLGAPKLFGLALLGSSISRVTRFQLCRTGRNCAVLALAMQRATLPNST
jgi:hypothetical protein